MNALPGSVIAVDAFGVLLIVIGIVMIVARGKRTGLARTEDPRRTARLIFGTMMAALGGSIIILFTLFALTTASVS